MKNWNTFIVIKICKKNTYINVQRFFKHKVLMSIHVNIKLHEIVNSTNMSHIFIHFVLHYFGAVP